MLAQRYQVGRVASLFALQPFTPIQTLGGALLVPRDALMRLIDVGTPEQEMADFFGVSTALIRERKNKTGIGIQLAKKRTRRP